MCPCILLYTYMHILVTKVTGGVCLIYETVLRGHVWPPDTVARIIAAMEKEHRNYYGRPCGAGRGYGFVVDDLWQKWVTSGGNELMVRTSPNGDIRLRVLGVRHGIPWYFIPADIRELMERYLTSNGCLLSKTNFSEVVEYETSEPSLTPWATHSAHPTQW